MSREQELFNSAKKLSPKRNSTAAKDIAALASEQLQHFNIDANSDLGESLLKAVERVHRKHVAGNAGKHAGA